MAEATSTFDFVEPAEALRGGFEVKRIRLGETDNGNVAVELLTFPDLDGKPITIPRFSQKDDEVVKRLKEFGANLKEENLSSEVKERLYYCLNELKLPALLAVHLAINRPEIPLQDFPLPETDTKPTVLLMILGRAGAGKSLLTSALALKGNLPIFSLDKFSAMSPNAYLNFFKEKGLTRNSTSSDIIEAVRGFRKKPSTKLGGRAVPMRDTLDEFLEIFRAKTRPEMMIVDGVGVKDEPGVGLDANIYHLTAYDSGETRLIIIGYPTDMHTNISRRPLKIEVDPVTVRPLSRPTVYLSFYPDLSFNHLWEMRDSVLDATLIQFNELMPEIIDSSRSLRQSF